MQRQVGIEIRFFLLAGLLGGVAAYVAAGLLEDFYPGKFSIVLAAALPALLITLAGYFLLPRGEWGLRSGWLSLAAWLACAGFAIAVVGLCSQYPGRFDLRNAALKPAHFGWLALGWAAGMVAAFYGLMSLKRRGIAWTWPAENFPGLALSLLFLIAYFSLAVTLGILPDDNFYDTDSMSWYHRLAAPASDLTELRPVHPLGFLLFRPLVWVLSQLLGGERYHAVLLLNAGAGALCVFLAWKFVRGWSASGAYALMVAALLGLSTSHLVLSAALETYIFSAAALIAFLLLLRRENAPLPALVPAGLVIFGITITNFAQTCIQMVVAKFDAGKTAKYVGAVLAAALVLAFAQARLYPTSQPFYDPSVVLAEDRYSYNLLEEDRPRTAERAKVLGRTISTFSVVAPRPLIFLHETDCEYPCFQTSKHHWKRPLINSYVGLGSFLARTWFLGLTAALLAFAWKLFRRSGDIRLPAALLGCILFNFALHMAYGDDPLLYSGDWTYAVVFFAAYMAKDLGEKPWFQAGLLAWLVLLMINNWSFLRSVLAGLAPYLS